MGKGDQRSRRGKIWRGTFGKRRPKKRETGVAPVVAVGDASPKKDKQKEESTASSKEQEAE